MKTSTQQWLDFAKADLLNCERILDDDFLTAIVAFHSQQAVEKCFKALIEEKNLTIPRIHSLVRLYSVIEGFLVEPLKTRELLAFDSVYINSRYPSDIGMIPAGKPTRQDAKEFYESASNIFDAISKLIDEQQA
ncbi:MAG TPA: HEPN domain-containing protein [Prolixibacteraceae bacterium]|nr:HEPN domain-containing protein [Prolixibacteraceae bacterium]